jgi:hypothetical protein
MYGQMRDVALDNKALFPLAAAFAGLGDELAVRIVRTGSIRLPHIVHNCIRTETDSAYF